MMPGSDFDDYAAARAIAERKEVMRAHAEDIVGSHAAGLIVDPLILEWAQTVLVTTSRQWGHMGAGEPA